jgi:type I restriction-modification system DNA methylase subunit
MTRFAFRKVLNQCGYKDFCIREQATTVSDSPWLLAYCHRPFDVRTAAIAIGESPAPGESSQIVQGYKGTGAPIVILSVRENVEVWRQEFDTPTKIESFRADKLGSFFETQKKNLSPQAVYRAKNPGQVNEHYQMEFVDVGLMPFLERHVGKKLGKLLTNVVDEVFTDWKRVQDDTPQAVDLLLRSVFRLLAGKILRDKDVKGFKALSVSEPADILRRVTTHCGGVTDVGKFRREALILLEEASRRIFELSSLRHMSTESLGVIYENAFISKETRKRLGTHSTPPWLADYMMWQVEDWFREIRSEERIVYEPACGHGAFLVSALRMLQQFAFEEKIPHEKTAPYLRKMLYGVDIDAFSLEIARLSLSLTDIPNADGWKLYQMNLFAEDPFGKQPPPALVLTNPPYETFEPQERLKRKCVQYTKYAEILTRTLPHIHEKGILGFIAPRSFLTRKSEADIRKTLATEFEICEINQFPDKIFQYAGSQPCVILARRKGSKPVAKVRCGHVSECGVDAFRERYCFESVQELNVSDIVSEPGFKLCVPLLFTLWRSLSYNPTLKDIADIGRGLDLKPDCLAKEGRSTREILWSIDPKILYHKEPQMQDVAFEDSDVLVWRSGASPGRPQIVVNAARVRRNIWPIRALIDTKGLYVSTNLYAIRPKSKMYSVEFLWALLNSPIANAFVHSKSGKLHIIQETLETMPVPHIYSSRDLDATVNAVKVYFKYADTFEKTDNPIRTDIEKLKQLRLQVDAAILKLYDLAPRDERMLLDLFAGQKRPGVPFEQTEYFSRDFTPFVPLHEYLSPEYKFSTAGEIRKIDFAKTLSPRMKKALRRAVELHSDEE